MARRNLGQNLAQRRGPLDEQVAHLQRWLDRQRLQAQAPTEKLVRGNDAARMLHVDYAALRQAVEAGMLLSDH
jgi:hypothetical protein